ncbi:FKBP-type peptidyl-prolyl cis-trans isomerase [Serratia marcescens]|uniref:FKBP-type peptidyl-prolyl cis-trans isomerase N-terminal domain-containing protein n=1 Tax=Serratia marcescens TaxID=615 RepID=UPI001F0693A3|nr:FKBP-type peptidyl-prolyl cis-trans isomerase N-terminal domain-containing protein [Serratia marcescens]EIJ7464699.1 FKBP-type peptidyl-prolyl cis-trans isomerase [Serratia marcescens]EJA2552961.1 FKBP-type peptidyl-prolyl cis-trans isomerase [Serratia marcescens]EJA2595556.1 FKBP-type peptidyl-prolyl cis-trans isomerase [Serratia marcescens]UMK43095.1 FKBP-type peptidyl-prolyl cis-trans isomerase [Serratia marcescens]
MGFLLLAANGAACAADDGIPALLKFAEQRQAPPAALGEDTARKPVPAPAAKSAAIAGADGVRLTSLKQSLQQQAEKIRQLERQLAAAQAAAAPKRERAVVDIRPLADALKGLRQAVAPVPEVGALAASLTQAEQRSARLAAQLAQQQRIDTLLAERQQATEPPLLASEADKQAYAAGVSLGRDIVHLQQENRHAGLEADSRLLLAGIADTLAGRLRLDEAAIDSALRTAQQRLQQTQAPPPPLDDKAYLADFARQEGVKQDALGFYYRVDYAGNGAIGTDDRVDIVVRESLVDGRVVKDMELAGTVISQPLTRYPPLFRAAIEKLQRHGSITLVVPPALAYGKQGSPPAIPPDATMIYTLRIADVQP